MTPGKRRGLQTLTTAEGVFAVLAIDHRDSLRAVMPGEPTDAEITEFKLDLICGVGERASGVMLEPEFRGVDERGLRDFESLRGLSYIVLNRAHVHCLFRYE